MLLHHVQPRPELHLSGRWYDPTIGFFTTRDPFRSITGLPQSQHPYVYAHNNPINLTDPSGELVTLDMLWDAAMVLIDAGFLLWDALSPCLDQATRQQLMGQDLLFLGADATAFFIPLLPGGGGVTLLGRGAAALAETLVLTFSLLNHEYIGPSLTPIAVRRQSGRPAGCLPLQFEGRRVASPLRNGLLAAYGINDQQKQKGATLCGLDLAFLFLPPAWRTCLSRSV